MKRSRLSKATAWETAIANAEKNPAITIHRPPPRVLAPMPTAAVPPAAPKPPAPAMNDTEADYHRQLLARIAIGELRSATFEGETLRLTDDCHYTPDFAVVASDGVTEYHETKGAHVFEDSRIKFKWAARAFPDCRFYWAQRKNRKWTVRRRLADGWQERTEAHKLATTQRAADKKA